MPHSNDNLHLPIRSRTDGAPRRVGIELELSGLSLEETADLAARTLGGSLQHASRYVTVLAGDPAGPWRIELDFELLKQWGQRERADDLSGAVQELAEDALHAMVHRVVPIELISPPLPPDRFDDVNRLIAALRGAGARGTGDDPLYAFGLQLNPELPNEDADTIGRYLKAYLCLEDWLRRRANPDLMRRLTLFADPFPKAYVRRAVAAHCTSDMPALIDDYLLDNPTRNRGLDMLPLFAYLDEDRVRARVTDPKVKARPTLHYRLPNCEIDRPGWDLGTPWSNWLVVERLAADTDLLNARCADYHRLLERPFGGLGVDWAEETDGWLLANGLR